MFNSYIVVVVAAVVVDRNISSNGYSSGRSISLRRSRVGHICSSSCCSSRGRSRRRRCSSCSPPRSRHRSSSSRNLHRISVMNAYILCTTFNT